MSGSKTPQCPTRARHWFTYYGWVGTSAPVCFWCKAPNPNYDPDRDPYRTDEVTP